MAETPPVAAPMPAAPALNFQPVVTSGEWLGLHPLLDGSLMISAGPKLIRIDRAGNVLNDPSLLAGIELPYPKGREFGVEGQMDLINNRGGWTPSMVGGTWPGATFMTIGTGGYRPAAVYRWANDRWAPQKAARGRVTGEPHTVRAWKDSSLLAWRELYVPALDLDDKCSQCPDEMYETPEYKQGERDLAAAKQLVVLAGPAKGPPLSGEQITAFDALPSGEVFLALKDGSLLVLPAEGEPISVAAPTGEGTPELHGLVARAADDVLGFGARDNKAFLVRYDGKTLSSVDAPACEPGLASLSVAGATWWATCAHTIPRSYEELNTQTRTGSLWRREGAGAWEKVALRDGFEARVVVARAPDDVWVSTYGKDGAAVLNNREHLELIALGDMIDIVRKGFFPGAK